MDSARGAAGELAVEPVTGYRVWRLGGSGGDVRLVAMTRRTIWPPLEPIRATCPEHDAHDVPGSDCMCGLYAASSLRSLVRTGVTQHRAVGVVGAVSMWGRVIEHDRGVRASLAYPARMRLVCGPCLAERRGPVEPLEVIERDGEPVPLCARHLRSSDRGVPSADVQAALLGTYAVDLLPLEVAARGLGHRRGTATILRHLDAAPRVPERLRRPARAITVAIVAVLVAVGVFTARREADDVVRRASTSAADGRAFGAAGPAGVVQIERPPTGATSAGGSPGDGAQATGTRTPGVTCGVVGSGVIQEVACREGRADAVGFTSSPPAPRASCDGRFEWYTRTRTWSACWFVLPSALGRLDDPR